MEVDIIDIYKQRLGPLLLGKKKKAYKETIELLKPQFESGLVLKDDIINKFDIEAMFSKISDVTELPYNKELRRAEMYILHSLDKNEMRRERDNLKKYVLDAYIGYFPIDDVNAYVTSVDQRKFLILVNEGLLYCIYKLCFLAIAGISVTSENGDIKLKGIPITTLQDTAKLFFDEYFKNGTFPTSRGLYLHPEKVEIINCISKFAVCFTAAHEFGHLINGDIKSSNTKKAIIGGWEFDVCNTNWNEEFQADNLAIRILFLSEESKEYVISGILIFFLAAQLLENLMDADFKSHPPSMTRLDSLYGTFKEEFICNDELPSIIFNLLTEIIPMLNQ